MAVEGEGRGAVPGIYNKYYIKLKNSVTSYLTRSQPLLKIVIPEVLQKLQIEKDSQAILFGKT